MEDFIEDDYKQSEQSFFAIIPCLILDDKSLSDFDKILYSYISSLSKKHGHCWATNNYLSQLTKRNERTIQRSLKNLSYCGYIVTDLDSRLGKCRVIFINSFSTGLSTPPTKMSPTPDKNVTPPPTLLSPPYMINKMINKEDNSAFEKNAHFEEVWLKYPKRVGKKEALRHYKASVKTEKDALDINTALKNYIGSKRVGGGYIQNGSTWFNNWRDWITMPKGEEFCQKCRGSGKFISSTGYEITCKCQGG